MVNKKVTKRALLASVLALVMCISMLVGSTYAWFTDSVSSVNNVIKSGNLDVELYYQNDANTSWTKVDGNTNVFKTETLWEPGHVEVIKLQVANEGTLALKYQLGVNVASETGSKNVYGEDFKLSDYIYFGIVDGEQSYTREEAVAAVAAGAVKLNAGFTKAAELLAGNNEAVTLVVYMPESVGNEANYAKGEAVPKIDLGINLYAIQYTYEEDSFGNDYDEGLNPEVTYVADAQGLKDAMLVRGAKIALNSDITVDANTPLQWGAYMFVANGREVTIDLNGHDIIVEDDALLKTNAVFTTANGGTLNIVGDGTVNIKNEKSGIFHAMNKNDQINIYGGTYISNTNNGSTSLAIMYTNSGNIDVYGGMFRPLDGVECANAEDAQGNRLSIVFHEGAILKHTKYYAGYDATRIQLAEGCRLDEITIDGETWYMVVSEAGNVVASGDDFIGATDGGNISIVDDIVHNNTDPNKQLIIEANAAINFDGNGNTITVTGSDPSVGNHGYVGFVPPAGEDVTVSDLTVTGTGFVEMGHYGIGGGTYEANNLVIKDLVSTLANKDGSDIVGCAFAHYGTATLNNCIMTGTTAMIEGSVPYDAGFVNGTTTTINGGEYGKIYLWSQAHVTINDAEIDVIDSKAITTRNLGMLTIGAGTHVGTINLVCSNSYTPALTIEEGATVDAIVYQGVTYTQAEWLAR